MNEKNDGIDKCGWRMDESCMAALLYLNDSAPIPVDIARYNQDDNSIVVKKHFLEIGQKWYNV